MTSPLLCNDRVPCRPTRRTPAWPRTTATRSASSARLADGEASVDLSHRPVVRVAGPDRLTWLHSLTSQHLEHLAPGVPTEALVLRPHGHVEHALYLVDDGEATWAHVEPGTAEALVGYLDSMRFWSKVEVEDLSSTYAVVLTPSGAARCAGPGSPRRRGVVRAARATSADRAAPAGRRACGRSRRCASPPAGRGSGFETDHRTIPHEVGWLETAVHLDKGCYRGQETVARVHNLGRPPRRLVLLHLDGSRLGAARPRRPGAAAATGRSAS